MEVIDMINWINEKLLLLRGLYHILAWLSYYQMYKGNYGAYKKVLSEIQKERVREVCLDKMIHHCKCIMKIDGSTTMAEYWKFLKECDSEIFK